MAINFSTGTQSAPVLQTRQFVRNAGIQTSYSSNTWTGVAALEGSITPTSSSSYIRVKFILPVAGGTSANSTIRVARRIGGGSWGECDSVLQSTYPSDAGVSRPRGHHMSIWHTGSNWSINWNIAIDLIDRPNTTSTVFYRPEMMTDSTGTNYWGVNNPGNNGNGFSCAPCIMILEDVASGFIGTYDGQAS